jgi:glycosyltransferase involved in cell wall biosynthesis
MTETVSVVVPVYNNQQTLEETCRQIMQVRESDFKDLELEIVFVNDGSKDNSWEELNRIKDRHPGNITLINLSRNFGQLGALFAGFNAAKGDAVICVSADLQDPISLIGRMVSYWKNGTEVVVCYRQDRDDGYFTRIFSGLAYAVARFSCPQLPKGGFDYWLMSRRVRNMLCAFKGRHNFIQGYLLSIGFSQAFIPYVRAQRQFGKSGYELAKKIKIVIDFVVDSSYLPIRFMSCLGMLIAFCGVVYSLLIIWAWSMHRTPFPGWAPIMIVVMVIGGIIMVMLGIIGEYIWRIYDNSKDFPLFIVADRSDTPSEQEAPRDQQPEDRLLGYVGRSKAK